MSSVLPPPSSVLLPHVLLTSPLQFDTAVKNLAKMAADQTTKCQNHYKREFQMIGKSFTQLGQAMEGDGGDQSSYYILHPLHAVSNFLHPAFCTLPVSNGNGIQSGHLRHLFDLP